MKQTDYVLGFAFYEDKVLLIQKQRPLWQKGLYNGIGGHIEAGEKPADAMAREFKEEAGIVLPANGWRQFLILEGIEFKVYCFACYDLFITKSAEQMTDEGIYWFRVGNIKCPRILNLDWIIPMALDQQVTAIVVDHTLPGEGTNGV